MIYYHRFYGEETEAPVLSLASYESLSRPWLISADFSLFQFNTPRHPAKKITREISSCFITQLAMKNKLLATKIKTAAKMCWKLIENIWIVYIKGFTVIWKKCVPKNINKKLNRIWYLIYEIQIKFLFVLLTQFFLRNHFEIKFLM